MDDKKEPLPSAIVQVFQNGILKGGAPTDYDGDYVIKPIAPGEYDVIVLCNGFDSIEQKGILVVCNDTTTVNFSMQRRVVGSKTITIRGGKVRLNNNKDKTELIDQPQKKQEYLPQSPDNKSYIREKINNFPH